jgi:hypothetical protein
MSNYTLNLHFSLKIPLKILKKLSIQKKKKEEEEENN